MPQIALASLRGIVQFQSSSTCEVTEARIADAVEAAEQVFDPRRAPSGPAFEPTNINEAQAAVQRLGELFEELPGSIAEALDGARSSGSLLSSDRLQGLAEIVQNADDVKASQVCFLLRPTELLVSHDGTPVRLPHVLGFATPWLSTKAGDASTIGRFGVGLSALQSLSTTLEVHCAPYHVRIGDPTIAPVEPPTLPTWFREPGWTTLRIPLQSGALSSADLEAWLDDWDDSALLFLRHVERVTLRNPDSQSIRQLKISRHQDESVQPGSGPAEVSREFAIANDGRSWAVYRADMFTPAGVERARKATERTTPVSVAIPLRRAEVGQTYAGLPVIPTNAPLFVNAQFDPLTSRADFADTSWNAALVDLVAEVWSQAVFDCFKRDPQATWQAIPLPPAEEEKGPSPVVGALEAAVVDKARHAVAARLSFPVPEQGLVALSRLAVETSRLEGVLQEGEIAKLAGLRATLPFGVRDQAGRWRSVLEDWRSHGAGLPEPVRAEQALDLLEDITRPVESTIALVAAALQEGLDDRLLHLPCVIARDGRRILPPAGDSMTSVSAETTPLAEQLGIATLLHPAHLAGTNGAPDVLVWLRECGALLDSSDSDEVVRRIAQAGRSGHCIDSSLTDEQLRALRDAFEHIAPVDRAALGPDVGRAVLLRSYRYGSRRRGRTGTARPADVRDRTRTRSRRNREVDTGSTRPIDAYLPRAIDKEPDSFAVAAGETTALEWLSDHYAKALRSQAGREGLGALRFLRLLGAETTPRLQPHEQLRRRYKKGTERGLPRQVEDGPEARASAMSERGATYTLEDLESPDLIAVITDISRERRVRLRRTRAGAVLAALGRAWDRRLSEFAEVDSADDSFGWKRKGRVPAFWLAQAGDVAWLDDESGTPRKPAELRVRTPGTEAIYGPNSRDYLHADLDQPIRRVVLTALGVSSDPSRSELVARLRELRSASDEDEISSEDLRRDAALIYRAIARGLNDADSDADLNASQLRAEFTRHRLVLTNLGWLSPQNVLAGPPIFGHYRAFAPAISDCGPLWLALRLRRPSASDCLEVLAKIAYRRRDAPDRAEEAILLETLRTLAKHLAKQNTIERRKLTRLALWTSAGWTRARPVYATDDPVLAAGLGDRLPIWRPGGGIEQFRSLLGPLRVTRIRADEARVIDPELAEEKQDLTELFRESLELLHDDLQRHDPALGQGLTVPWDRLALYAVKVLPSLSLEISAAGREYDCEVTAKVDTTCATVFVREAAALSRVDGGGRALAALFEGEARLVAQAWRAACDQAEEGIKARRVPLASELAARERAELDARLAEWGENVAKKHHSPQGPAGERTKKAPQSGSGADKHEKRGQSSPVTALRVLVDPQALMLVDPKGRTDHKSSDIENRTGESATSDRVLKEPKGSSRRPQNRSALRGYSDLDKENVGFELLQVLLGTDQDELVDLRTQRGVGADAIDQLKKYYELKVFAGAEPDRVTLTDSEVQRALTTADFFLVVVSNVEESDEAQPTIRVVIDPLEQLRPTDRGAITLSGLRDATSRVYRFASTDDEQQLIDDE